mmetsp:Transcript_46909/g.101922  ORF Transcript_46909/g.101922 Transcript_46909/m.101922 type:complete len:268 (-) Transcript_46909:416-1219(-)
MIYSLKLLLVPNAVVHLPGLLVPEGVNEMRQSRPWSRTELSLPRCNDHLRLCYCVTDTEGARLRPQWNRDGHEAFLHVETGNIDLGRAQAVWAVRRGQREPSHVVRLARCCIKNNEGAETDKLSDPDDQKRRLRQNCQTADLPTQHETIGRRDVFQEFHVPQVQRAEDEFFDQGLRNLLDFDFLSRPKEDLLNSFQLLWQRQRSCLRSGHHRCRLFLQFRSLAPVPLLLAFLTLEGLLGIDALRLLQVSIKLGQLRALRNRPKLPQG